MCRSGGGSVSDYPAYQELAADSSRHIHIDAKLIYWGVGLNPSQEPTAAVSTFELPCGELPVGGALFF